MDVDGADICADEGGKNENYFSEDFAEDFERWVNFRGFQVTSTFLLNK